MGKILYWINLENYSFKIGNAYRRSIKTIFKVIVHQIGKIYSILYQLRTFFYIDVCCDFTRKSARRSRGRELMSAETEVLKRNFDAQTFSWNRGVTKWFIHFDEFWRFSYELMIYFLSLPPIIENHFLLVHLSRCRQAQLLLNPHCCNWAWGFPGTKYKQKEKLVPG